MSKQRLTRQQSRRIANQRDNLANSQENSELENGLVIARFGNQADVETDRGEVFRCHLRRNLGDIVTGDKVVLERGSESAVVASVKPAKNRLQRPDSYGKLKAVAANIDQMVIVIAPQPQAHANLIDRYLVVAENLGVTPLLLVNKCDLLSPENRGHINKIKEQYDALGYRLLEVSAKTAAGQAQLKESLAAKTSVFVGQSGVGKSSLLQKLLPHETLKIGELSEQVNKGKHTTTHAALYHFQNGGNCIDSPGIREFGLWHFTREQVVNGFSELREIAQHCKFRDCTHKNDPGCAIRLALEENGISEARYLSFLRIIDTLDDVQIKAPGY